MTRELEVFLKERASGYYRPTAFFIVKVSCAGPNAHILPPSLTLHDRMGWW